MITALVAALCALGAFAVGLLVGITSARRKNLAGVPASSWSPQQPPTSVQPRPPAPMQQHPPVQQPRPPVPPQPPVAPLNPDIRLVNALIGVHDLGDGVTARERISEELAQVGVRRVDVAPGTRFDSAHHKAVQRIDTVDPAQSNTVAALVRPGWSAATGVLRFPEVAVYGAPTGEPHAA